MQKIIILIIAATVTVTAICIPLLGVPFGAYWLVLQAGAPSYVAVIVGIVVFLCAVFVLTRRD